MKIYSFFHAMAVIAFVGLMAACSSSDEEIVADSDDAVVTNKTITANFGLDGGEDNDETSEAKTRLGGDVNYSSGEKTFFFKGMIYSEDDFFWVYSPSQGWFNKLAPARTKRSASGYKSVENSTVKFTANEVVYAMYYSLSKVKTQDAHDLTSSYFVSKDNDGNTILTFKRADGNDNSGYDYNLAYIYGKNSKIPYTDEDNPYSFRVASALISKDGYLQHFKHTNGEISVENDRDANVNLVSYVPKILFSMSAASNQTYEDDFLDGKLTTDAAIISNYLSNRVSEVNEYLSKLEYKIIVDAVPVTAENITQGYPDGMTYRMFDTKIEDDKKIIEEQKVIVPKDVTFTIESNRLKLYYGVNTKVKNTCLWNTTTKNVVDESEKTIKDYEDLCAGNVYIPLPATKYKLIRVLVNVSCPTNSTAEFKNAVQELCHTYKIEITTGQGLGLDNNDIDLTFDSSTLESEIKNKVSAVYDLGSIWGTRTKFLSSSSAKTTRAVQPGNGWEIVDDSEFDF